MNPLAWIQAAWNRRVRRIDVDILWPSCRDAAPSLARAHEAFLMHACQDPAWIALGEDEMVRRVYDLR